MTGMATVVAASTTNTATATAIVVFTRELAADGGPGRRAENQGSSG